MSTVIAFHLYLLPGSRLPRTVLFVAISSRLSRSSREPSRCPCSVHFLFVLFVHVYHARLEVLGLRTKSAVSTAPHEWSEEQGVELERPCCRALNGVVKVELPQDPMIHSSSMSAGEVWRAGYIVFCPSHAECWVDQVYAYYQQ